jgi:hypothetical protein
MVELVFSLLRIAGVSVVGLMAHKRSVELLNKQLESRRRRCLLVDDPEIVAPVSRFAA